MVTSEEHKKLIAKVYKEIPQYCPFTDEFKFCERKECELWVKGHGCCFKYQAEKLVKQMEILVTVFKKYVGLPLNLRR